MNEQSQRLKSHRSDSGNSQTVGNLPIGRRFLWLFSGYTELPPICLDSADFCGDTDSA